MAPNYKPATYRSSGGDQFEIESSGRVLVKSGGEIDFVSGSRLEIAGTPFITSGGNIALGSLTSGDVTFPGKVTVANTFTLSSGFIRPYETPATGVANPLLITGYGITQVWSSGAGSSAGRLFTLPAPVAGVEKWVVCIKSTSTGPTILSSTGGGANLIQRLYGQVYFSSGATNPQWIHLMGENTTNWMILSRSTDMTFGAT